MQSANIFIIFQEDLLQNQRNKKAAAANCYSSVDYSLTIKLFEQAKQDAAVCCQYRSKYQGYNGHQFDQDVHCRSGR